MASIAKGASRGERSTESELEEGRIITLGDPEDGNVGDVNQEARQQQKSPAEGLRKQVFTIGGDGVAAVAVLSFRALQLYRIGVLQKRLVEIQHALLRDGEEPAENIDSTLQKYADAVRNYETLTQDIVSDKQATDYTFLGDASDDFKVVDRNQREPEIWSQLWQSPVDKTVAPSRRLRLIGPLGFRELDRRRRLERERVTAHGLRVRMAAFGGVALIVPMLIMALHPGLVVALVTTSVATVLFGAAMVVMLADSGGRELLASTAAYTAVLVVFVGTSLTPGTSGST